MTPQERQLVERFMQLPAHKRKLVGQLFLALLDE